jgi:hypothetical protein
VRWFTTARGVRKKLARGERLSWRERAVLKLDLPKQSGDDEQVEEASVVIRYETSARLRAELTEFASPDARRRRQAAAEAAHQEDAKDAVASEPAPKVRPRRSLTPPTDVSGRQRVMIAGQGYQFDVVQRLGGNGDLPKYFVALLKREPTNPHDPNAILVLVDGKKIGYVPRERAARWADGIDRVGGEITCRLQAFRRPTRSRYWRFTLLASRRALEDL